MHQNSQLLMRHLLKKYVRNGAGQTVIDVGSCERMNGGSYRPLCERMKFDSYTGLDIEAGPNVDVVIPEHGEWSGLVEPSDVVISGQCLEHTRWPWVWIRQVVSVVRPGGLVVIIAPWSWHMHRYPMDCWRILPDGMESLFEWAGIQLLKAGRKERDCFGVGVKPCD